MKLFPYQDRAVEAIEDFGGRCLIGAEMGLGKTLMALDYLRRHPEVRPAVIVCPASVKYHWEREAKRHLNCRALVLEGRTPFDRIPGPKPKLIVLNYDILRHWAPWLRSLKPRAVVIDESHMISNSRAQRTRATRSLCRGVKTILALSGTPLVNRPIELWPTLNLLRPKEFSSRWNFGHKFCDPEYTPWGWNFRGASNTQELHKLLTSTCMVRLRKADCLKDLPPKMRQVITLPIRKPEEYREASNNFLVWLAKQDLAKAQRAARAEAINRMCYLKRLAAKLKLKYVVEWINQWIDQSEGKLVVFTWHRKALEAIHAKCSAPSLYIDGSITGRKKQEIVDEFQRDNEIRILVANIAAAGTGLTLTAASTVVFAELTWRPGDHVQAEDRCHRIGAKKPILCVYLVSAGTIEEYLCEVLQRKQKVLSLVLDGGGTEGDLDVYNELLEKLQS